MSLRGGEGRMPPGYYTSRPGKTTRSRKSRLTTTPTRVILIPTGRYGEMRRPIPDSPTKEKLLDAAQELMLTQGYTATSVDEVCQSAGLTKGSFFHYFQSKEDLGMAVVRRFADAMWKRCEEA